MRPKTKLDCLRYMYLLLFVVLYLTLPSNKHFEKQNSVLPSIFLVPSLRTLLTLRFSLSIKKNIFKLNFWHKVKPAPTTTSEQRRLIWRPIFRLKSTKKPLNSDYMSTTATLLGSRGWSLYSSLTVFAFWATIVDGPQCWQNPSAFGFVQWQCLRTYITVYLLLQVL